MEENSISCRSDAAEAGDLVASTMAKGWKAAQASWIISELAANLLGRWNGTLKMHMYPVSPCVYVSGAEKGLMRFSVSSRLR